MNENEGFKNGWFEIVEALGLAGGAEKMGISNAQYHASVVMPKIAELMAPRFIIEPARAEVSAACMQAVHTIFPGLAALPSDIAKPDAPQPFTDDEPFDGGSLTLGAIERERNKRFEELITLADDDENHAAGLVLVAELVGLDLPCSMEDIAREIRLLKSRRIPASRDPRGGRGVDD